MNSVERVSSTTFLKVHISEELSWTNNTTPKAKKTQTRLYFPPPICSFLLPPIPPDHGQ
ncbi:hypothetical protein EXN66_Car009155 [Channa argus]|uniref:Uncharacterized protein n=1 Tax=Channa argus TaxID=215402 RepID=A0A6G1PTC5_CHAAH|nr:hypothetical protein EXN66_Car009155 [Channa argus]